MAACRRRSPAFAAPELQFTRRPASNTNPRHTNRIFVERMISSSQNSRASEKSTVAPVQNMGAAYALLLFRF
jgi:hypothetical protein